MFLNASRTVLAEASFRGKDIESLFNVNANDNHRRWVLELLRISQASGHEVEAIYERLEGGGYRIEYTVNEGGTLVSKELPFSGTV